MLFKKTYTFARIDRDTAPDKRDAQTHFNITNFETYFTDRGYSLRVSKGPGPGVDLRFPGGSVEATRVLGEGFINNRWFIFVTANTNTVTAAGSDAIYEVSAPTDTITLTLVTSGDFNFSTLQPIQCVGNREGDGISKLYFVDGENQARWINVDLATPVVNDFLLYNPAISWIVANHNNAPAAVDAVVRYSYSTYNLGGTSSKVAPFTDPLNISVDHSGVGITVGGLSAWYSVVRIYRLKYETYNSTPTIDLIAEREYPAGGTVSVVDDGTLFISTISLEEYLNIGSEYVIPSAIESKKQHLFFGDVDVEPYILTADLGTYDFRAYGYEANSDLINVQEENGNTYNTPSYTGIPLKSDAINTNPDTRKYTRLSTELGYEGQNIKILMKPLGSYDHERIFKGGETYRIGVKFFDFYGRESNVLWVTDVKIPYSQTGLTLFGIVKNMPSSAKRAQFVMVERTESDRSVLFQAIPQFVMRNKSRDNSITYGNSPFNTIRGINNSNHPTDVFNIDKAYSSITQADYPLSDVDLTDIEILNRNVVLLITPETSLYPKDMVGTHIRLAGSVPTVASGSYVNIVNVYDGQSDTAFMNNATRTVTTRPSDFTGWTEPQWAPVCLNGYFADYPGRDPESIGQKRITWMFNRIMEGSPKYNGFSTEFALSEGEVKFIDYDSSALLNNTVVDNTIDYRNFTNNSLVNTDAIDYESEFCSKYGIVVQDSNWAGSQFSNFPANAVTDVTDIPLIDVLNNSIVQYGGPTYEAKVSNIYVDASGEIGENEEIQLSGDTWRGVYSIANATGARENLTNKYQTVYDYVHIMMESSVDPIEYSKKLKPPANVSESVFSDRRAIEVQQWPDYNTVFSQKPNWYVSQPLSFNSIQLAEFPSRIFASNTKFPGERIDSWTEFDLGTYVDLDSPYGEVVKLMNVGDNLLAFQPRGIANVRVLPVSQTTSTTGTIQLGKGTVLDSYDYIVENVGATNHQAIVTVDGRVFFIDMFNKTLNELSGGDISTLKGFNTIARESIADKYPTPGGKYLYLNDDPDSLFVFVDKSKKQIGFQFSSTLGTLFYNYGTNNFTHTRTYDNVGWFGSDESFTFAGHVTRLYKLDVGTIGNYFGVSKNASLHMWVEPVPRTDKVYDAIEILKEGEGLFEQFTVTSPTRTSGTVPTDFKSKFDRHTTYFPRVENSRDRFRTRYVKVLLDYAATTDLFVDEVTIKFSIKKQ